jgi:hypothetical protein
MLLRRFASFAKQRRRESGDSSCDSTFVDGGKREIESEHSEDMVDLQLVVRGVDHVLR